MARGVADDSAFAADGDALEERAPGRLLVRDSFEECRKVVMENEGGGVIWVRLSLCARISGAQVAMGIVLREVGCGNGFGLTVPRPLCPVRTHQHPFSEEGIVTAMWVLSGIESHKFIVA